MKTILIIGATGAQGSAIARHLSGTGRYNVLAFTRSVSSPQAAALAVLPNVKLVLSSSASGYDTDVFLSAASGADYVLVNTDGFALGEQAETYWGIRLFELSARAQVKHFIYSGLDSLGPKAGYDPELYCGHYQGKAKVQGMLPRTLPTSSFRTSLAVLDLQDRMADLTCAQIGCTHSRMSECVGRFSDLGLTCSCCPH